MCEYYFIVNSLLLIVKNLINSVYLEQCFSIAKKLFT